MGIRGLGEVKGRGNFWEDVSQLMIDPNDAESRDYRSECRVMK